jgi:hypothetical protein
MTKKILEKYSTFPLQKFFKRYCKTAKIRHELKNHLKELHISQNSCKMLSKTYLWSKNVFLIYHLIVNIQKSKTLLALSTPVLSISKFVIACIK